MLNTPGTVDYGYTGEIKVIVFNFTNEEQYIKKGDKIAQAVICPVVQGGQVDLVKVDKFNQKIEMQMDLVQLETNNESCIK